MKKQLQIALLTAFQLPLIGCAIKPVELPQKPYKYDQTHSIALHYAQAMGLDGAVDLPKGRTEELLKQREQAMLEKGLSSSLTGYLVSFAFAKSLGLSTSLSHDLAKDTAEDQFIMGAGNTKKKKDIDYNNLALYLPYGLAKSKEGARQYVFNYFINTLQHMGMTLEEIDAEYEYGTGEPFTHPLCTKLETECRYLIKVPEPVIAYAPEKLGGYKAWVWSPASRNGSFIRVYNIATWGQLGSLDMDTIKSNELAIQDTFDKPLVEHYPNWAVQYVTATYNEAPYIRVQGQKYKFEKPDSE
ncbi:TPA: hypothetical protein ACX6R4_000567 [Photobacterium damselae]|uniref:hypothetical protein n=1 Tax=Photobacterium damselae TaxID=38293 RepID=UPI00370AE1BD